MGKIIAVAIPKGGVGKTTTALNLALALSLSEKRTLLIDIDPAGACSSSIGFNKYNTHGDLMDVLSFKKSFKQVIHKTDYPELDFVPLNLISFEEEMKFNRLMSNQFLLRNLIHQETFGYNFVVIDCPPYLAGATTSVLISADSVIVPIKAAQYSLDALDRIMEYIAVLKRSSNEKLQIEGILLTMYEFNTRASFMVKKHLFDKFPNSTFSTVIPKNSTVAEATFHNQPIIKYDPNAKSSIAYMKLADEIIEKVQVYRPAIGI